MVGVGCQVKAPHSKIEETIHERDDIAVNPEQVRLRMRALVEPLAGAIVESADRIREGTTDRAIQREALLWKIEAVPALREALFRPTPFVAVMDTWVLTWQMTDYFESGRGKEALGDAAPIAVTTCRYLENQIETVAASMTLSGDVSKARELARQWAKEHPIRHSIASRESTLARVTDREIQEAFSTQQVVGNVVVTLDDLSRRMDIYSAQLLDQARWQAELFAMDLTSDYRLEEAVPLAEAALQSATEAVEASKRFLLEVEDVLAVVESAPELVTQERVAAIKAANEEISRLIGFVQQERIAALQHLSSEREVLTAYAEQISLKVVDHAMLRIAQLAGAILLAFFFGGLVLLFLARRMLAAPR
jgi:AraC-like DNA-binding protein